MKEFKCYICKEKLDEINKSKEHIIPNSIGGKLKSNNLLCKTCNSQFGDSLDNILTKQFKVICNFLNIKRNRGKNQDIVAFNEEGAEFDYPADPNQSGRLRKPHISVKKEDDGKIKFSVFIQNKEQIYSIIKKIENDYPNHKIENKEKVVKQAMESCEYNMPGSLTTESFVGNPEFFMALHKILINFFIYKTGDFEHIEHLINKLKNNDFNLDNVFYYVPEKIEKNTRLRNIKHQLVIISDKRTKKLYGYIELFSVYRYIIVLNENYNENHHFSYTHNVITGEETDERKNVNYKNKKRIGDKEFSGDFIKEVNKLYDFINEKKQQEFFQSIYKILEDNV